MKVHFKIDQLDSLGQGVAKINGTRPYKILFVQKTLPTEEGVARVYKQSKGVAFGFVEEEVDLNSVSTKRIRPQCQHFSRCPSCHYQHTSYSDELVIKTQQLTQLLQHFIPQLITTLESPTKVVSSVIASSVRLGYRNRIQLHYNVRQKKLGYIDPIHKDILPVPQCLIAHPLITSCVQDLYHNEKWLPLARQKQQNTGHVEIFMSEDQHVQLSWNLPYASGGFEQVHPQMNKELQNLILQNASTYIFATTHSPLILDLFGGSGNLTRSLPAGQIIVVDQFIAEKDLSERQFAFPIDLDAQDSLTRLQQHLPPARRPELLIIDPPRRGFRHLFSFIQELRPQHIFYISCNPSTLGRDLAAIAQTNLYQLNSVALLDLFPSTYHFETFVHLMARCP